MVVQCSAFWVYLDGEKPSFVLFLSLDNVPSHSNVKVMRDTHYQRSNASYEDIQVNSGMETRRNLS